MIGVWDQDSETSIPKKVKKPKAERLPWPRFAKDDPNIQLGVDIIAKRKDIIKLVHRFFKVNGVPMEELLQEVYAAILHKNCSKSAHDPRKSSFGHYVYMIANNVCINLVHKKKRYDREGASLFEQVDEDDTPIVEAMPDENVGDEYDSENVEALEEALRKKGRYDLARYIRAARTGASSDVLREALNTGVENVDLKFIREIRKEVISFANGQAF
jgi:hypothetical protein